MKTMSCKDLGGPCDLQFTGKDANEIIKAQDAHLKAMSAAGDASHEEAAKEMKGLEEAVGGDGLVPERQARVRGAARRLIALLRRGVPDRLSGTSRVRRRSAPRRRAW